MQPDGCILSRQTVDDVFKALADESRRKLLDELRRENAETHQREQRVHEEHVRKDADEDADLQDELGDGEADEASDRSALYERASHLVGRFRDTRDARDVSTRHDRYLDEAFE